MIGVSTSYVSGDAAPPLMGRQSGLKGGMRMSVTRWKRGRPRGLAAGFFLIGLIIAWALARPSPAFAGQDLPDEILHGVGVGFLTSLTEGQAAIFQDS